MSSKNYLYTVIISNPSVIFSELSYLYKNIISYKQSYLYTDIFSSEQLIFVQSPRHLNLSLCYHSEVFRTNLVKEVNRKHFG